MTSALLQGFLNYIDYCSFKGSPLCVQLNSFAFFLLNAISFYVIHELLPERTAKATMSNTQQILNTRAKQIVYISSSM